MERSVLDLSDVLTNRPRVKQALLISGIVLGAVIQVVVIAAVVLGIRVSISLKDKLADSGPCGTTTLYSRPSVIATGDQFTIDDIAGELRAAGSPYQLSPDTITIPPAYARVRVDGGKIVEIKDLQNGQTLN